MKDHPGQEAKLPNARPNASSARAPLHLGEAGDLNLGGVLCPLAVILPPRPTPRPKPLTSMLLATRVPGAGAALANVQEHPCPGSSVSLAPKLPLLSFPNQSASAFSPFQSTPHTRPCSQLPLNLRCDNRHACCRQTHCSLSCDFKTLFTSVSES